MKLFEAFIFSQKILGMNSRNLSYIKPNNKKRWIKLVDDKIRFKKILEKNDIPTPKLLGVIRNSKELSEFDWNDLPSSFVLKPTNGFGGEGIIVIFGENKKRTESGERLWVKGKGVKLDETALRNHINNILDGTYSRTNSPDVAFFEERIKLTKLFKPFAYKGIPDIRVIVYNRVPIMAMLRLPTRESDGKANLHQGGIGVGIDIATGVTTNAIMKDQMIDTVPGTRLVLSGIRIPHWDDILDIAIRTADVTKLGFAGIDIVIDRDQGPVVLEANARPGLAIQIANLAPLKERLEKVKDLKIKTTKRAIRLAKNLFGGEIEEEIEEMTGKQVIKLHQVITLYNQDETAREVPAKVDTGADSSSIDINLLKELGMDYVLDEFAHIEVPENLAEMSSEERIALMEKLNKKLKKNPDRHLHRVGVIKAGNGIALRPYVKLKIKVGNKVLNSVCSITDRTGLKYPFLLGKKDLKHFLIDPVTY